MEVTLLLGPANADHYRVRVGRYGDRHYMDPLPADDIAPATDAVWPSVSTIKKASGSDWSLVALKRVAQALERKPHDLDGLTFTERYERLKAYNRTGLNAAGDRGTGVHAFAEQLLLGQKPNRQAVLNKDAEAYLPALNEWFDEHRPILRAKEIVCINRTVGYAGTTDGLIMLNGQLFWIDWKSRGEDSEHGCYPEEAAQLAAYARAEYMITESGRVALPHAEKGIIVSIRPDGCRTYPVDLDKGFEHWRAMHAWWTARRSERDAIGKPWAPKMKEKECQTASTASTPESAATITEMSFSDSPTKSKPSFPSPGVSETPRLEELTFDEPPKRSEPSRGSPTTRALDNPPPPKPATPEIDEGPEVDVTAIKRRYDKLSAEQRAWIGSVTPFNLGTRPTERRVLIALALIRFAQLGADDELLRTALHVVTGEEVQPVIPVYGALQLLTINQAKTLNQVALAIHDGAGIVYTDDGPVISAA